MAVVVLVPAHRLRLAVQAGQVVALQVVEPMLRRAQRTVRQAQLVPQLLQTPVAEVALVVIATMHGETLQDHPLVVQVDRELLSFVMHSPRQLHQTSHQHLIADHHRLTTSQRIEH